MNRSSLVKSLRPIVALVVTLLQVVGALHFSLIRHSYSAAMGGVVHVHAASSARSEAKPPGQAHGSEAPRASSSTPSCSDDLCSAASAPQSVAPVFEALDRGAVDFGDARLLSERFVQSPELRRVLLGAPKTSPPA